MVLHGHAFCPLSLLVQAGWLNPTEIERRSRERTVGEGEEKKEGRRGEEKERKGEEESATHSSYIVPLYVYRLLPFLVSM